MIDEDVTAVILAVIAAFALFAGFQLLYTVKITESSSELAILGSDMEIGDYPKEVQIGESFTLFLHVANHEGHASYFQILVKLGDEETQINEDEPMSAEPIARYEVILPQGGNWRREITLSITEPGVNKRLVFELWKYKTDTHEFQYHGRWNQLWLNVTSLS